MFNEGKVEPSFVLAWLVRRETKFARQCVRYQVGYVPLTFRSQVLYYLEPCGTLGKTTHICLAVKRATGRPYRFICIWIPLILLLAFRTVAVANETLIPHDWQPTRSATVAKFKAELEPRQGHRPSQRELSDIASRLAEAQDAELFVTYVRLLETLDATQRRKLFREQQQWLRDRETKAAGQVQSKGGSSEALKYSGAFIDLTELE